jgi:hypothetical protein
MKIIKLTTVHPLELKSFIVENIQSYENLDHNYDGRITIVYMKDGNGIHVKQTVEEIDNLIDR